MLQKTEELACFTSEIPPVLKKEASPAVLGGGENPGNALEASNALNYRVLGHPSRTLEGNSRKRSESVSGSFRNFSGISPEFLRKVPAVLGVWPITRIETRSLVISREVSHRSRDCTSKMAMPYFLCSIRFPYYLRRRPFCREGVPHRFIVYCCSMFPRT